ncbi:MAG: hypothetical protein Q4A76_01370 [Porphyromonadaceae bacterium]|nr:DUF2634 domain-containing protein [Butyricicoccus pullicaecorum]MDO4671552.1 hypothetical protein [Porphyromonadaceae bacterium]
MLTWILDKIIEIASVVYKKKRKEFSWAPKTPMRNGGKVKDISTHPKDYAMVDGDIQPYFVEGEAAFIQKLRFFISTERRKYPIYSDDYGIEEAISIFSENNPVEFERQCNNIALHLMDYFNEWIEEIYRISRRRDTLVIELKVAGKPDTLKCEVQNLYKEGRAKDEAKV